MQNLENFNENVWKGRLKNRTYFLNLIRIDYLKSLKGGDLKGEFISKSSVARAINSYTNIIN